MKFLPPIKKIVFESVKTALLFILGVVPLFAQKLKITETQKPQSEGFNWGYILILGLGIALGGTIFWWLNRRKGEGQNSSTNHQTQNQNKSRGFNKRESFDQTSGKLPSKNRPPKQNSESNKIEIPGTKKLEGDDSFSIFTITQIEPSKPFIPLPLSNDESLINAIEQAQEEFEEDEEIRALSLKVLAAFKKRNSVEAISQIALYDVSANLRSQAVNILSEFDHESVFETILMACADPSRGVRAAAARGLFRLSFERSEAWLRLGETTDIGRLRQAARAVLAGDFVQSSIERLIHPDKKIASEAFFIILLLIKAGETKEIFNALHNSKNKKIKMAILHVIKISSETNAIERLYLMLETSQIPNEIRGEVEKVFEPNLLLNL